MAISYIGADVDSKMTEFAVERNGKITDRDRVPTDIRSMSNFLSTISGRKIMTVEEGLMAGQLFNRFGSFCASLWRISAISLAESVEDPTFPFVATQKKTFAPLLHTMPQYHQRKFQYHPGEHLQIKHSFVYSFILFGLLLQFQYFQIFRGAVGLKYL